MGWTSQIVDDGRPALDALRVSIDDAQGASRLTPVTVVVPSNSVGVAARRWLAAHGGIAAVQFATTFRLAELLGAPALVASGRRPVSTPVVDVAVRRALRAAPGMFAAVAHHHATISALRDAHRQLRHVPETALERLTRHGSARAAEVVRIHRLVTAELAGDWYDEADLLRAACANVPVDQPATIVHLPDRLRPTEHALLARLAAAGRVHTIESSGVLRSSGTVEVVDASDADEEVREVVRLVVTAARDGIPFERMAVAWPVANPYARLLTEQLDAAGIAWNGRPGTTLQERLAARLLLDVLGLDRRGLRRADLFTVLAHVPARDLGGRPVPAARWERLSRAAGLAAEADWHGRLEDYAHEHAEGGNHTEAADARALGAFVADLRGLLGPPRERAAWSHWASACDILLDRWLGGPRRIAALPPVEHAAYTLVEAAVRRLAQLDRIDGPVTRAVFLDTLDAELDTAPSRVGRIGTGVQVGPLAFALGQSVDLMFVLGAAEGQLPSAPRADPLLSDGDRRLTDGALVTSDEGLDQQRRQFVAALAAAERAVVLRPRGDLRTTADRQPSRWIAALAAPTRGVPSFAAGVADASFPATAGQHRIRSLVHHCRAGNTIDAHPLVVAAGSPLARGLAMVRARESTMLTAYDGDLGGIRVPSPLDGTISPSRLEAWSACPHAYFMRHVLQVEVVEHPDTELRIRPTDQGTLVHDALDQFHRRVIAGELPQPGPGGWTPEHLAALEAELEAAGERMAASGRVGRPASWAAGRVLLRTSLRRWLAADGALMAERGARIVHSEMRFGIERHADSAPAASIELPSGRVVRLRGQIDRVDRGADGTLYVTDHKTGSDTGYTNVSDEDPTAGGRKLQLAAYAAAARQLIPDTEPVPPVRAEYSFITAAKRRHASFAPGVWPEVGAAIERIVDGIAAGLFFSFPARSQHRLPWVVCEYCDPDHLGTAERYEELIRKLADPRLAALFDEPDDQGGDDE